MQQNISEETTRSPLYSDDLAPVPTERRTWNKWNLAALWVGMAVCIPTYILASYMIKSGLSWQAALIIIFLANLVITIPMALNGHAGVKYGVPFPVIGRATFGTKGIHIPSAVRAFVACGWFGVQTWIGGLAFYSIWNAITCSDAEVGLSFGKFTCFGLFWIVNIYFIWKGTESIKWLEDYSAPILILIGLILIFWGYKNANGFMLVLEQGAQLQKTTAAITVENENLFLQLHPLQNTDGTNKASEYQITVAEKKSEWLRFSNEKIELAGNTNIVLEKVKNGTQQIQVQLRGKDGDNYCYSSMVPAALQQDSSTGNVLWTYILWFTAMVGFWATMSLSIADVTRFAKTQKDQIAGQFIGLPGTMIFYSFVGVFVTCAAIISFNDVLIAEDAPWDPVSLMSKFKSPVVVVFAQVAMLIATLSTNIAANVIAPANAISNMFPKKINFKTGGIIAGLVGIAICPWWLMNEISGFLIFVSGLLGPVLGIMLCDYFIIKKSTLQVAELYKTNGAYSYSGGFNSSALIALVAGVLLALCGKWVPPLEWLYSLSWFTGFVAAFVIYYILMRKTK